MIRIGQIKKIEFKEPRVYPCDMSGWFLSRIIILTDINNEKIEIEIQSSDQMSMEEQNTMLSFNCPIKDWKTFKMA